MAPLQKSSKVARRGGTQIVKENAKTLQFFRHLSITASTLSLIVLYFYYSRISLVLNYLSCVIYFGTYKFMAHIAKPQYTQAGQLRYTGVDLNMEGGIAQPAKKVLILTATCQILSAVVSNYCWYLWVFIPLHGMFVWFVTTFWVRTYFRQ